jgi:hypothetical protein
VIETRLADAMAEAHRSARDVFRSKPRKFARTLDGAEKPND